MNRADVVLMRGYAEHAPLNFPMSNARTAPTAERQLLTLLADGEFHSGETLAGALGVSRAAVWKRIKRLSDLGLQVVSVRGKGYCLPYPLEFLSRERIDVSLDETTVKKFQAFEIFETIDSTNRHLLRRLERQSIHGCVCLAEFQSAGRGRRARHWVTPYGSGLCLSIGWDFGGEPAALTGLGLVIGVGVARALDQLGLEEIAIKWPNDVFHKDMKLGGILIDLQSEDGGPAHTVIGVGVNFSLPATLIAALGKEFRQPWTDLTSATRNTLSRNEVAASILEVLFPMLEEYQRDGFQPFRAAWRRYDFLKGRNIYVDTLNGVVDGAYYGVDDDGALLLSVDGEIERHYSGDVSITPQ